MALEGAQRALIRFRGTNWFSNGLLLACLLWWAWNWFAPPWLQFDDHQLSLMVFLISVEASWATALIYQHTSRADEELRRFLRESTEGQAQRVREILELLRETSGDVDDIVDTLETMEGEKDG